MDDPANQLAVQLGLLEDELASQRDVDVQLVPSVKRAPVLSGKAEPFGPGDAVGSGRRARVAQFGTPIKAWNEGWPGIVARRGMARILSALRSRLLSRVRGKGPPPKGASWFVHSHARMARMLGQSSLLSCRRFGTRAWGLGSVNAAMGRSSGSRQAAGGWAGHPLPVATLRSTGREQLHRRLWRCLRQALGGSVGLSFMR